MAPITRAPLMMAAITTIFTAIPLDARATAPRVELGEIDVPRRHLGKITTAVEHTEALANDQTSLIRAMQWYMQDKLSLPAHGTSYWDGVTPGAIVRDTVRELDGLGIKSYGFWTSWYSCWAYGTIAKSGDRSSILLNRRCLARRDRDAPDFVNTFFHEAAHRVGYGHAGGKVNETTVCQPPYVLGSLAEGLARYRMDPSTSWVWDSSRGHCSTLHDLSPRAVARDLGL